MTDARAAREAAHAWMAANRDRWPGLRAAHFVGSLTSLPDDAPFPAAKDIDIHLVFDETSPALIPTGPFAEIVEEPAGAWVIEGGIKSVAEYVSPEAVLANPETAHHLTADSILHDPSHLLARLQGPVRADYAKRRWVAARLAHERRAYAEVRGMLPMVMRQNGVSGGVLFLGYLMTFPTASFGVAALGPPSGGSGTLVHLRTAMRAHGRGDLYDDLLKVLGMARTSPDEARAELATTAEIFDEAVAVRRSPHPFQHKLHTHLRPYLVGSVTRMIEEGDHREGLAWAVPYRLASLDVLRADGDAGAKIEAARRQEAFLASMGFTDLGAVEERLVQAELLYGAMFDLADETARTNPAIVD